MLMNSSNSGLVAAREAEDGLGTKLLGQNMEREKNQKPSPKLFSLCPLVVGPQGFRSCYGSRSTTEETRYP